MKQNKVLTVDSMVYEVGETMCFSELWDGNGGESEGRELLESGCIAVEEENVIDFEIVEDAAEALDVVVKITDIR